MEFYLQFYDYCLHVRYRKTATKSLISSICKKYFINFNDLWPNGQSDRFKFHRSEFETFIVSQQVLLNNKSNVGLVNDFAYYFL